MDLQQGFWKSLLDRISGFIEWILLVAHCAWIGKTIERHIDQWKTHLGRGIENIIKNVS